MHKIDKELVSKLVALTKDRLVIPGLNYYATPESYKSHYLCDCLGNATVLLKVGYENPEYLLINKMIQKAINYGFSLRGYYQKCGIDLTNEEAYQKRIELINQIEKEIIEMEEVVV